MVPEGICKLTIYLPYCEHQLHHRQLEVSLYLEQTALHHVVFVPNPVHQTCQPAYLSSTCAKKTIKFRETFKKLKHNCLLVIELKTEGKVKGLAITFITFHSNLHKVLKECIFWNSWAFQLAKVTKLQSTQNKEETLKFL